MKKKALYLFNLLALLAFLLSACAAPAAAPETAAPTETPEPGEQKLILATTTSTQGSGLLDYLLPMFEQETGIKTEVIVAGTGEVLKLGEEGGADVLLVHARSKEDAFMSAGHGVRREDVMYNDFVIVCPESDPAGLKGLTSAAQAFKKIAETQTAFVTSGDNSGTNIKELAIWKKAGIETPAGSWYIPAGQGMGGILALADEQQACTLSDRATYLTRSKGGLKLVVFVEGDQDLLNPYGAIAVNPAKNPNIHAGLADQFIDWIISLPVQEKIAEFGKADFGQALFVPNSALWLAAH